MKYYLIKAYADTEYGLKEQRIIINAENLEAAKRKGRDMFPEYHEVGVFELKGGASDA